MKIDIPLKFAAAALAVAVPLAIGWSVTAGASSEDDGGLHTHDVYEVDGYGFERENVGGVVTNIITDPDGNVISVDEAPAEIVDMVENWVEPPNQPSEIEFVIADDGSSACYIMNKDALDDADPESGWEVVTEEQGNVAAARFDNGTLEAKYFGDASNASDIEASILGGTPLGEIAGAQEMSAC